MNRGLQAGALLGTFVYSVLVIGGSYLVSEAIRPPLDSSLVWTLFLLASFLAVTFIIWLISVATRVIGYFATKRSAAKNIVTLLHRHRMPVSDEVFYMDWADAFLITARRRDLGLELREFLLLSVGEANGMKMTKPLSAILLSLVVGKAWEQYKSEWYAKRDVGGPDDLTQES